VTANYEHEKSRKRHESNLVEMSLIAPVWKTLKWEPRDQELDIRALKNQSPFHVRRRPVAPTVRFVLF